MKKQLLALLLALCMVLALTACGGTTKPVTGEPDTPQTPTAEETAPAEEPLTWPTKGDINVLIPANTGGDTDTTFRTFSTEIGKTLGTNVMLTNMAGGAGALATYELLDYEPDGYTGIWHHYDSILLTMKGETEKRYDEYLDVAAVIPVTGGNYLITVNKDKGWTSLQDLVDYATENPGELVWAVESGGWNHVFSASVVKALGVDINLVDFGSSSDRNAALLGGNADILVANYANLKSYPDDFMALASCSLERQNVCPDIPTMKELGYGDIESEKFYYFGFKAGTDERIVDAMGQAIKAAVDTDAGVEVMTKYTYTTWEVLIGQDALDYLHNFENKYQEFVELAMAG